MDNVDLSVFIHGNILIEAIYANDIDIVKSILNIPNINLLNLISKYTINMAVSSNLDILKLIFNIPNINLPELVDDITIDYAIRKNNIDILKFVMNTKNINFLNLINRRTILEALEMKNIDIINYILDINGNRHQIIDSGILYKTIELDDFNIFKKIIEIKKYGDISSIRNEYVFRYAILSKNIDIINYILENNLTPMIGMYDIIVAIETNEIQILDIILKNVNLSTTINLPIINKAIENNNKEILYYILHFASISNIDFNEINFEKLLIYIKPNDVDLLHIIMNGFSFDLKYFLNTNSQYINIISNILLNENNISFMMKFVLNNKLLEYRWIKIWITYVNNNEIFDYITYCGYLNKEIYRNMQSIEIKNKICKYLY
jgi:hypothetical protein